MTDLEKEKFNEEANKIAENIINEFNKQAKLLKLKYPNCNISAAFEIRGQGLFIECIFNYPKSPNFNKGIIWMD